MARYGDSGAGCTAMLGEDGIARDRPRIIDDRAGTIVRIGKIACVGWDYPARPVSSMKATGALRDPNGDMPIPRGSQQLAMFPNADDVVAPRSDPLGARRRMAVAA